MKSNFSKLAKILLLLAFIGGTAGLSFSLVSQHLKTQERQKLEQAKNLLDQRKYVEAISAYDRLLKNDLAQAHLLWINRGYAWSGLKQYENMLKSCSNAIEVDSRSALAWNCRGEALYYLNRDRAALKSFERAIAIDSKTSTFWLNKSRVLSDLERYTQAIAAVEPGIELLSKSARKSNQSHDLAIAYSLQGQSWLKLKQNKKALAAFARSLEYLHSYLPAQQGQGIALYRLGFYDKAIEAFENILQRDDLSQEQQAINLLYKGISLCQTPTAKTASPIFTQVLKLTTNPQVLAIAKAGCGIR